MCLCLFGGKQENEGNCFYIDILLLYYTTCVYTLLYCCRLQRHYVKLQVHCWEPPLWRSNIKLHNNHIGIFLWFLLEEEGTGIIHISFFHLSILKEEKLSLKVYNLEKQSTYLNLIKKKDAEVTVKSEDNLTNLKYFILVFQIPFRNLTRLHHLMIWQITTSTNMLIMQKKNGYKLMLLFSHCFLSNVFVFV